MKTLHNNGIISHTIEIEVPFFDVDSMYVAWHGHYVKYFEIARCALLEKINYDYAEMEKSGYAWPVVDLRIKYVKPVKFKQKIIVNASLVEYENRIKIEYLITDKESNKRLTKGYTIQAAVDMKNNTLCYQSPAILLKRLSNILEA